MARIWNLQTGRSTTSRIEHAQAAHEHTQHPTSYQHEVQNGKISIVKRFRNQRATQILIMIPSRQATLKELYHRKIQRHMIVLCSKLLKYPGDILPGLIQRLTVAQHKQHHKKVLLITSPKIDTMLAFIKRKNDNYIVGLNRNLEISRVADKNSEETHMTINHSNESHWVTFFSCTACGVDFLLQSVNECVFVRLLK